MQDGLRQKSDLALTSRERRMEFGKLLCDYVKYLTNKTRVAATKILLITLSEESRTQKPYSWVIQAIPYKSISNVQVENFMKKVSAEVESHGGHVTARVSDGEHNSLRYVGQTRPRSILKVHD